MVSFIHKAAVVFGVALGIVAFVGAFFAHSVTRTGPSGAMLDGSGRSLSESPLLMRLSIGQERLWTGWFSFGPDMVVFWGGLAVAYYLVKSGWSDK